jgi:hypothetical protein
VLAFVEGDAQARDGAPGALATPAAAARSGATIAAPAVAAKSGPAAVAEGAASAAAVAAAAAGNAAGAPPKVKSDRPQLRLLSRSNEELSSDALPINGYEFFVARDYSLSALAGDAPDGADALFYIVSPKDVVVARPTDVEDHVDWLLRQGRFEEALRVAEEAKGLLRAEKLPELRTRYLNVSAPACVRARSPLPAPPRAPLLTRGLPSTSWTASSTRRLPSCRPSCWRPKSPCGSSG